MDIYLASPTHAHLTSISFPFVFLLTYIFIIHFIERCICHHHLHQFIWHFHHSCHRTLHLSSFTSVHLTFSSFIRHLYFSSNSLSREFNWPLCEFTNKTLYIVTKKKKKSAAVCDDFFDNIVLELLCFCFGLIIFFLHFTSRIYQNNERATLDNIHSQFYMHQKTLTRSSAFAFRSASFCFFVCALSLASVHVHCKCN
jgi:hypothetical protein